MRRIEKAVIVFNAKFDVFTSKFKKVSKELRDTKEELTRVRLENVEVFCSNAPSSKYNNCMHDWRNLTKKHSCLSLIARRE